MTSASSREAGDRIRRALLDLLRDTPWDKVRVSDIASHSGLSRQTVYRHFHSREEILRAIFDDMFEQFYETAAPYLRDLDQELVLHINFMAYSVALAHRDDFITLAACRADDLLTQLLKQYFKRLVGAMLRQRESAPNTEYLEIITDLLAGGTFQALKRWAQCGMKQTPQEMARIQSCFFHPDMLDLLSEPKEPQ